jgi:hypothetical protein
MVDDMCAHHGGMSGQRMRRLVSRLPPPEVGQETPRAADPSPTRRPAQIDWRPGMHADGLVTDPLTWKRVTPLDRRPNLPFGLACWKFGHLFLSGGFICFTPGTGM